jgi:hypothetical protein
MKWEKRTETEHTLFSGSVMIGRTFLRGTDGRIGWSTEFPMRALGKTQGDVSSVSAAKRAVENAFNKWISAAGLEQVK